MAQSVAGAISTATHGSNGLGGSISSAVVALRMVFANGSAVDVDGKREDLLLATSASMGAFGVITQVTFQCIPFYKLRDASAESRKVDDFMPGHINYLHQHPRTKLHWHPRNPDNISVSTKEECTGTAGGCKSWWEALTDTDNGIDFSIKSYESEMNVDATLAAKVFDSFRRYVSSHQEKLDDRVGWYIVGRYVAPERAWLAPANGRLSVYWTFDMRCADATRPMPNPPPTGQWGTEVPCKTDWIVKQMEIFGKALENISYNQGLGRPHFGKVNNANASYLALRYPQHGAFVQLRDEVDPRGIFMNDYLRQRLYTNTSQMSSAMQTQYAIVL